MEICNFAKTDFCEKPFGGIIQSRSKGAEMKIKLAVLDHDKIYIERLVSALSTKYTDQFEMYSFTNQEIALSMMSTSRMDVFLFSDMFDIDMSMLPKRCSCAYFVDANDVDKIGELPAVCKYQKVDLIYKQILSLYSESAQNVSSIKLGESNARIIGFTSAGCGCGSSTLAAACAVHYAAAGYRCLYLNIEKFGSSDVFFSSEGQFGMSEVIFALKSNKNSTGTKKKTNLSLKLESCVKTDKTGVYFYSAPNVALDMIELKAEEIQMLIDELVKLSIYDYIIVDMDFGLDKDTLSIMKTTHAIVLVSDASKVANEKTVRALKALEILDRSNGGSIYERIVIAYNRLNEKNGTMITGIDKKAIGGVPVINNSADPAKMTESIAKMNIFDNIMS